LFIKDKLSADIQLVYKGKQYIFRCSAYLQRKKKLSADVQLVYKGRKYLSVDVQLVYKGRQENCWKR